MFGAQAVRFYDALYADKDYSAESRRVLELVRSFGVVPRTVLDVACGTGAHLAEFAAAGLRVTGVDLAEGMVEAARVRLASGPGGTTGSDLHTADLVDLDLGRRFDLVVCLFSSVAYAGTVPLLHRAIDRLAAHVAPGGALVIEPFHPPDQWLDRAVGHDVVESDDTVVVRVARSGRSGDTAIVDFHLVVATADETVSWDEHHEFVLAPPDEYLGAVTAAGLSARLVRPGLPYRGGDKGLVLGLSQESGLGLKPPKQSLVSVFCHDPQQERVSHRCHNG